MIKYLSPINLFEPLGEHFTASEIWNASGLDEGEQGFPIDMRVIDVADKLRNALGQPITVNSAYRGVQYNADLRGASTNSQHIHGRALDLSGDGLVKLVTEMYTSKNQLYHDCYECGLRGIGFYDNFIHIDVRPQQRVSTWNFLTNKTEFETDAVIDSAKKNSTGIVTILSLLVGLIALMKGNG